MSESPYTPAYVRIADDLRKRIKAGNLRRGDRLPSEREICEQWDVSNITARAAIAALRGEGLVESVRGKGTFVRKETPLVRLAPQRYFRSQHKPTYVQEAERAEQPLEVDRSVSETVAPEAIAERLGVEPQAGVTRTDYFIRMGGKPVSMSESWEPLALTGTTTVRKPDEGPHADKGIIGRFEAIGYLVDEIEEILDCRMPTQAEARRLEIPSGVPVIAIQQTWRAAEVPVCTVDITFPADRYELHYRMAIPTP